MIDAVTIEDAKRVAKRLYSGGMLVTVAGRPKGTSTPSEPLRAGRVTHIRHGRACPAIHACLATKKAWMPGTPGMRRKGHGNTPIHRRRA